MTELRLPYPPSANHLWIRAKRGMRKSPTYTAWLMLAGAQARKQRFDPVHGPYKLSIAAERPDRRRRDIDNIIKPVSDLLVSIGIIRDDCDCVSVTACWVTSVGPAGLPTVLALVEPAK